MRKIETLPSGRYKVRFRRGGKETSMTFSTKPKAVQFVKWLDALRVEGAVAQQAAAGKRPVESSAPTLDLVAADHIEHLTGVEHGTRVRYSRMWQRTWGPLIGGTRADQLTKDDVARAVNKLGETYAEKSLKNQRGLLSAVCDRLVELGHQRTNPAKGIRLARGNAVGEEPDEMVCLTTDEWALLYDHLDPYYRPLGRFLVGTGCRWGEAVALRVGDVDLEARTVRFTRALKHSSDGKQHIGVTKTKRSRRTVVLPPELVEDLWGQLEGKAPADLVFTGVRGGMVAHRTFWSDKWRPAIFRAQHCAEHTDPDCRCGTAHPKRCTVHEAIPPACGCDGTLRKTPRIHDLRHTHASWLLAAGVPIHVVQARLGHESIQTTVDTYSHLMPDAQVAAASAASLAFGSPRPLALG